MPRLIPLQYVQELRQISLHLKSVWSEVLLSFWLKFLVTGKLLQSHCSRSAVLPKLDH